jgi:hypothetical protein
LKEDGVTGTTATLLYLAAVRLDLMTGNTAVLLYLAATFGSMALGAIIALWKEK